MPHQLGGLIQVQAPLYPGDSGAVVANLRGQLLGLIRSGLAIPATAKDRVERDNDFGFALAVREVLWVADQLRAHGHVERAYLGVRLEPVVPAPRHPQLEAEPQPAASDDPLPEGAVLLEVMAGTPAAEAGLRAGDMVIAMDGQPVRSPHDLTDRLDRLPAQSMIHLEIVRGRRTQAQQMTLALRTSSRMEAGSPANPSPTPGQVSGPPAPSAANPTELAVADSTPPASGPPAQSPAAKAAIRQVEPQTWHDAPAVVSIPGPARSPLRAPVQPPQAEELKLTLPRAFADRLEQMERRLEKLERIPAAAGSRGPRQASSARTP